MARVIQELLDDSDSTGTVNKMSADDSKSTGNSDSSTELESDKESKSNNDESRDDDSSSRNVANKFLVITRILLHKYNDKNQAHSTIIIVTHDSSL